MSLGRLLSGAGQVLIGKRQEEDALRASQQQQLQIEQLNRLDNLRRNTRAALEAEPIGGPPLAGMREALEVGDAGLVAGPGNPGGAGMPAAGGPRALEMLADFAPRAVPNNTPAQKGSVSVSPQAAGLVRKSASTPKKSWWSLPSYDERVQRVTGTGVVTAPAASARQVTRPTEARAPEEFLQNPYVQRVAQIESGGDYNVANVSGRSTAHGAFQITRGTFIDNYKRANPGTRLNDDQIWDKRRDRATQDSVMAALTARNGFVLGENGIPLNDVSLYLAHFLGAQGAVTLLNQPAGTLVESIPGFAAAVKANPAVMRGKTVEQVVAWAARKMTGQDLPGVSSGQATPQMAAAGYGATPNTSGYNAPAMPAQQVRQATNFYMANPDAVSADMQVALAGRQDMVRRINTLLQSGMALEADAMVSQLRQLDQQLVVIQAGQAMSDLSYSNDPRRMAALWSYTTGNDINIRPYTDGTFDVLSGGKVTRPRLTGNQLADEFQSAVSPGYRQQKVEDARTMAMRQYESGLRALEKSLEQQGLAQIEAGKQAAELMRLMVGWDYRGRNELALERLKMAGIRAVNSTDGRITFYSGDGQVLHAVDPNRPGPVIDNVQLPGGNMTIPIAGLPVVTTGARRE